MGGNGNIDIIKFPAADQLTLSAIKPDAFLCQLLFNIGREVFLGRNPEEYGSSAQSLFYLRII